MSFLNIFQNLNEKPLSLPDLMENTAQEMKGLKTIPKNNNKKKEDDENCYREWDSKEG